MRNARKVLLPLFAALLTGGALAAPAAAQRTAAAQPGQAQPQQSRARTPQAMTVAYYRGDPLNGGQLLGTRTVTPQPGERPFQNAPSGATHGVVTTPFGKRVVNLSQAQPQPRPGGADQRPGGGPDGAGPNGTSPQGGRGAPGTPDRASQGDLGPLGGALRGATRVTFYSADPLQGGRALRSVTLGGNGANPAAITQAAQGAKFAVVERPGERVVVDLSATAGQPGRAAPQGPGRQ